MLTQPQTALAEELRRTALQAVSAPVLEQAELARRTDALLDELGRGPGSPEAMDTLRSLLKVEGFEALRVPGHKPCWVLAIDVLASWGYLEALPQEDRDAWREQSERWSRPGDGVSATRPRMTGRRALAALSLVLLGNGPGVAAALLLWGQAGRPERDPIPSTVLILLLIQLAATFIGTLRALLDRSDAGRAVGRRVLWLVAALYGIAAVPFFFAAPSAALVLALPAAFFLGAAQLL